MAILGTDPDDLSVDQLLEARAAINEALRLRDDGMTFAGPVQHHWDTHLGVPMANRCLNERRPGLPDQSDFALANDIFMVDRNDIRLIVVQTDAKERIRWLSAQLAWHTRRAHSIPTSLCDDRCASQKGYPCNCAMAAFTR